MAKYIIFQADQDEPFWEDRMLQHSQALTEILQEVWDYSNKLIPEPNPHLDITSSINIISIPPKNSCITRSISSWK